MSLTKRYAKPLLGALTALAATALFSTTALADRAADMAAHRGGTLRLVTVAAEGTIDPHINYTLKNWQIYQLAYDGLVNFSRVAGPGAFKLVPSLAEEIPTPTDGGKTWTFKIRKGVKFSNGKDLTPDDVVASLRRIFKVSGPTAGTFYNGIVGADACLSAPADCKLEGVTADAAAGTVTIALTAPDSEFLYKLAVPHAAILPADAPAKDVGTDPIPGTGAYMIQSYDPNQRMKLVRNPYFKEWSEAAQPDGFVDEIDYDFGLTEEAAITAIQNGQADWLFDPPPADRLNELGTTYAAQVHVNPLMAFWYAPMNTNLAPFNDARVRQAVNYAIDRSAIVDLFGGPVLAQPVCQILPPNMPGHEPVCQYTTDPGSEWSGPDMDKAKALVEESGTAGQEVTIVTEDTAVSKAIGTYLQTVLGDLGYKAAVKPISSNIQFTYIQNTNNKVQMSISQWYQDYPQPSNFLNILLSCASFTPGADASINISGYCNKDLDARMKAALELAVTDPEASYAEWTKIDQAFMDAAPMAPLFTPKRVDFVSSRVGNYMFSSQFYMILANVWVK
ncbi:ABC transporter substrate-binding protein [Oharaeibacter diazotrophicus]|uniref:Peptide/nickel transport system substrate-binding protein n=1 Tax=Oharaeibacter diazotrophicus TaxID=1920512 RepID=A0A4R6RIQ8_9HYPH|nr:ABC transporter substrate-binding protein [Oharaeibacter diazotrophicus]TDP86310.1 peptide/nickel transport system substrate-binding protein [Oharaeibacter diazotrophicus]BBE71747.1 periplasmic oligopeptide-binding protein precursor [Pleomorphomonas sp. SM30]GLS78513.1 peptide ABC transporter substrate-binding protein [Oharaeibacter diazotrophicus]